MSVLINLQDMFKTSALSTHTHTHALLLVSGSVGNMVVCAVLSVQQVLTENIATMP